MTFFELPRLRFLLATGVALVAVVAPTLPVGATNEPQATVAGVEGPGAGTDRVDAEVADAPVHGQVVLRRPSQQATAANPAPVQEFLHRHNLKVTSISSDGSLVNFDGPVGKVQQAFATRLARFRDRRDGRVFRAAESSASLPSAIAGSVLAVHGLSGRYLRHHGSNSSLPCGQVSPAPSGGLTPTSAKQAYSSDSGITAGLDGTGQRQLRHG